MLTRKQVFDILYKKKGEGRSKRTEHLYNHLIKHFGIENDENIMRRLKAFNYKFCHSVYSRIDKCGRKIERFQKENEGWLNQPFNFEAKFHQTESDDENTDDQQPSTSTGRGGARGRPKVAFSEGSSRTKRRRAAELSQKFEAEELTLAAKKGLKQEGNPSAARLISEAVFTTPTRPQRMLKAWDSSQKTQSVVPLTPDQALSLMVETKESKHSYLIHRATAKNQFADIYPSYHKIRDAKSRCYPNKEGQTITETSAEIRLQDLLDHTTRRILDLQKPVIENLSHDDDLNNITLLIKWGCDGSTGHSQYKQVFSESGLGDGDMFLTSLVPLQLYSEKPGGDKVIIWQNPRPSSTRFCRPIRFQFKKETTELTVQETTDIEEQISRLIPTKYITDQNRELSVSYICAVTMINGKVCNVLSDTSSAQTCYICKATPRQMNLIHEVMELPVNEEVLRFGLSSLHAWIRCFECLLHISYRLGINTWQVRGQQNKDIFEQRKRKVQADFRDKMGLLVDIPKSGGSGTTNDGNTARRFFAAASQSASITGLSEDLIKRFGVILRTLSCGYAIDVEAFKEYALQTARLYVDTYPWYYMPASVHKILIHGAIIITEAMLPIGQLSEEAQESRNKDLKQFREFHARKMSRVSTNEDLLNRLFITSDPLISSLRQLPPRKSSTICKEVLSLLEKPSIESSSQEAAGTSTSRNLESESEESNSSSESGSE
jgi:hypothetical protein